MFNDWTKKSDKLNSTLEADPSFLQGEIKANFVQSIGNVSLGKNKRILDLSKFSVKNFNTFSELGFTNIHFTDFYETLFQSYPNNQEIVLTDIGLFKLFFGGGTKSSIKKFDLILCWDIFNYLSEKNLAKLTNFLFKYSTNSANLFALIHTKKKIPEHPINFELNTKKGCFYSNQSNSKLIESSHNITTKQLQGLFTPWYLNKISLCHGSIHDVHFTKISKKDKKAMACCSDLL